jgi:hypothetical protein
MVAARYFGDVYDCKTQSQSYQWGDKGRKRLYLGRLRLDAFLNRCVVIKDADLIDGRFFLENMNSSMIEELPINRLQFSLRTNSFKDCLLLSFKNLKMQFLKPLILDSISESDSRAISEQLH